MAGCAKAGRNKGRPAQKRYKAESHDKANAERRAKRIERYKKKELEREITPRGSARSKKRRGLQRAWNTEQKDKLAVVG